MSTTRGTILRTITEKQKPNWSSGTINDKALVKHQYWNRDLKSINKMDPSRVEQAKTLLWALILLILVKAPYHSTGQTYLVVCGIADSNMLMGSNTEVSPIRGEGHCIDCPFLHIPLLLLFQGTTFQGIDLHITVLQDKAVSWWQVQLLFVGCLMG